MRGERVCGEGVEGGCIKLVNLTRGEGGQKVPTLISKILIFATITTTATKFGDYS